MNKIFSVIKFIFFMVILIMLVSCDKNTDGGLSSDKDNRIVLYTDSAEVEFDGTILKFDNSDLWLQSYLKGVYASFEIKNTTYNTKEYVVKDYVVTKEETKASYTTSTTIFMKSFKLDAELSFDFSFSATTPSSIKDDKYKLDFTINNQPFTLYLYETPDELLPEWSVKYKIDGSIVNTKKVRDNKELGEYIYDYPDHTHYCNSWKSGYSFINAKTKITSNLVLDGTKSENIKWMTTGTDAWSYVSGINHIPADGILVIPSTNQGKEICIGMYAIKGIEVKKIYLPKTIYVIYGGNFTGIGDAIIYYEGTEAEWKTLFYTKSDIKTNNVVYNTKYQIN